MADHAVDPRAIRELHRTRRRNRLADVHWIDALYRVYLAALAAVIFLLFASSQLPDDKLDLAQAADVARQAPAALGLVFAVAVAIGLRSGGRGGPLVLEAPVVVHELSAPVPRQAVLLGPALKQLRFLAFAGAVVGAIVGEVASRRLPVNIAAAVVCAAAAFALAAVLSAGAAMVLSGRKVGWWPANGLAALVLGWSAIDILLGTATSPLTFLGQLATWPLELRPLALIGAAVAVVVAIVGVLGVGGLSIEAALRRAGLVSQLRFAVTLQDVRTVVLLRRQLAQERPRAKPWLRLRPGGRLPAAWKRDWQSTLRFPAVRLARLALLGAVGGLALGGVWRGLSPLIVVAGLALYVAAYDAAEPIAQEVDHPTRWESFPMEAGRLLLDHVPAAMVMMILVSLVAAASSMILVPPDVVIRLTPVIIVPIAAATALAAGIGSAQGAPDTASLVGLGPDLMGMVLTARLVLPPALAIVAFLPLLTAGTDPNDLQLARVANTATYPLFVLIGAYLWLRTRKPKHL